MNKLLRSLILAATFSLATLGLSAADTQPGEFDLGHFTPAKDGQHIQINISAALLKFAAKIAAVKEPETAELIANLRQIRVNVVSLDEQNRDQAISQIDSIRTRLTQQGWAQVVSVLEKNGGDNVAVHIKQNDDETIAGIVVTVLDKKGEAVCINIVGNISAEQLGKVAEKFDIDPLRKVHAKIEANGA